MITILCAKVLIFQGAYPIFNMGSLSKPFYIVVDFKEYEEIKAIQESRKRKIAEMTEQLIEDNKEAFLELAK